MGFARRPGRGLPSLAFGYVTHRMQSGLAGDARGFALIAAVTAAL